MIQEGDVILGDRYAVLRQIGKGGFCTTFEVEDSFETLSDGSHAIKVMKVLQPGNFNRNDAETATRLFQREAEVLRTLNHPGIPKVEQEGYFTCKCPQTEQRLYCLVMEKIEGQDLSKWLARNQPISETQALNWLEQIVKILDTIHPNFLHRDIKPSNIMLRPNGELVLIDFGAVKKITKTYIEQQPNITVKQQDITKIFSAGFTPQEQKNGQTKAQSDFFALGRTFVNWLTGKHPTDLNEDPRIGMLMWREEAPLISDDLVDLIDWLMEENWRDRPKNTREILRGIQRIKAAKRSSSYGSLFSFSSIVSVILNFVFLALMVQGFQLSPGLIWLLFLVLVVISISILFPVFYRQLSNLLK